MTQYARYETKSAPLHSDFGRQFLARRFGDDLAAHLLASLPTYTRGPRKGLVKGYIHWKKVTEGGWHRGLNGRGGVVYPGTQEVRVCVGSDPLSATVLEEGHFPVDYQLERQKEAVTRAVSEVRWK